MFDAPVDPSRNERRGNDQACNLLLEGALIPGVAIHESSTDVSNHLHECRDNECCHERPRATFDSNDELQNAADPE